MEAMMAWWSFRPSPLGSLRFSGGSRVLCWTPNQVKISINDGDEIEHVALFVCDLDEF